MDYCQWNSAVTPSALTVPDIMTNTLHRLMMALGMLSWMLPGFSFFNSSGVGRHFQGSLVLLYILLGMTRKQGNTISLAFLRFVLAASNFEAGFQAAIKQQVPQVQCSFPMMQLTAHNGSCQG